MKLARHAGGWGVVTDDGLIDVSDMIGAAHGAVHPFLSAAGRTRLADIVEGRTPSVALDDIDWAPFLPDPEKIVCVGVNYPDRNAEYKDGQEAPPFPSLFMRAPASFTAYGKPLIRPHESDRLDYEGEIVIVIGEGGRRIPREEAHRHIAGLTLANEGTLRDWVRHSKFNVTQGKNFDRSGALGPWMVTAEEIAAQGGFTDLRIRTRVNGELRQDDTTANMIFPFDALIEYISSYTTLKPGDLIVSGTPTGAGARFDPPKYLKPGDRIEVACPAIGTLVNGVADG